MSGRSKTTSRKKKSRLFGWWTAIDRDHRWLILRLTGWSALVAGVVWAGHLGVSRLEAHVEQRLLDRLPPGQGPVLTLLDLPADIPDLVEADLYGAAADLLTRPWLDKQLCRDLAGRLASVGWVERVNFVRRRADGVFEVSCRYRLPVAMVRQRNEFILVDAAGVRLPGSYRRNPSWLLIEGVEQEAPAPGVMWKGEDLRAALAVLTALESELCFGQITGVAVDHFAGRRDRRRSHVALLTDQTDGRIAWGSAPGYEVEENTTAQKIAILRANCDRTGRADANHPVIDVSTFPDRFTIPG